MTGTKGQNTQIEPSLNYDIRDIMISPARALSAKRILVMTIALVFGVLWYDIFVYIALFVDDQSVVTAWSVYGLLPFHFISFSSSIAQSVHYIGYLLALFMAMLGMFAVSLIEIEQMRGNRFLSITQTFKVTISRSKQMLKSLTAIVSFIVFIVLLILVVGLLLRLPIIGEWIYALTFLIPSFIASLFTAFVIFVLFLSVLLLPAVAATDKKGEAFTSILEMFSSVIRQPVRWVIYTAVTLVTAKISSFVYAYFSYRAVQFFVGVSSISGGRRPLSLIKVGLSHLPVKSDLVYQTCNLFPGIDFGFSFIAYARGSSSEPVGYVMAFMLFLIFASVIGYFLATVATAQTRGYAVIRYYKDGSRVDKESSMLGEEERG